MTRILLKSFVALGILSFSSSVNALLPEYHAGLYELFFLVRPPYARDLECHEMRGVRPGLGQVTGELCNAHRQQYINDYSYDEIVDEFARKFIDDGIWRGHLGPYLYQIDRDLGLPMLANRLQDFLRDPRLFPAEEICDIHNAMHVLLTRRGADEFDWDGRALQQLQIGLDEGVFRQSPLLNELAAQLGVDIAEQHTAGWWQWRW